MLVREFCAENMERVPAAVAAGAARVELCDNLAVGGTTPSLGVIEAAVAHCAPLGVGVMAMVRPRGGDFAYDGPELAIMRRDLEVAVAAGVSGVVFGCAREGHLDVAATESLLACAREAARGRGTALEVTFHMAFDAIAPDEQLAAIDWLASRGVTRVLTHGGAAGTPVEDNVARLRAYVGRAAGRIGILPGAGVTWENAESVAAAVGVGEVHGTRIVRI